MLQFLISVCVFDEVYRSYGSYISLIDMMFECMQVTVNLTLWNTQTKVLKGFCGQGRFWNKINRVR